MFFDSSDFNDLQRWYQKGICANNLLSTDGMGPNALMEALKSLLVGLLAALIIQFIVVFMFQRDIKFDEFVGVPLFAVSLAASCISFLLIFAICLWALRIRIQQHIAVSLTCYILSGVIPLLALLSHEQLAEAIRLFSVNRDPSLPYFAVATQRLLLGGPASPLSLLRSWIFFMLEVAVLGWYFWNLSRVVSQASADSPRRVRVLFAILGALAFSFSLSRFYTGRLFWIILGRLL